MDRTGNQEGKVKSRTLPEKLLVTVLTNPSNEVRSVYVRGQHDRDEGSWHHGKSRRIDW